MRYDLSRPDALATEPWEAIEYYRQRLADAAFADDRPAVIGAAKELIGCIARCVLDATEQPVGDSVDFPGVAHEGQKALKRAAGKGISSSDPLRGITGAALNIATRVNEIRNRVGTGHGRARIADIDDEMAELVSDAAMLWCRWALRRLGHLMAQYPTRLLAELAGGANRERLRGASEDVLLPEQPGDIQRAIGVAFGREAAGGFSEVFSPAFAVVVTA